MSLLDCARTDCFSPLQIVKLCKERELTPAIVFSFSRRECEARTVTCAHFAVALRLAATQSYARAMTKLDFNTPEEKDTVQLVYGACRRGAWLCITRLTIRRPQTARWRCCRRLTGSSRRC